MFFLISIAVLLSCQVEGEKTVLRSSKTKSILPVEGCGDATNSLTSKADPNAPVLTQKDEELELIDKNCVPLPKTFFPGGTNGDAGDETDDFDRIDIDFAATRLPLGIGVTIVARGTNKSGITTDLSEQAIWKSVPADAIEFRATTQGDRIATGLKVGKAAISAAFGGKITTVDVEVTDTELQTLSISPLSLSNIVVGQVVNLRAAGTFADGTVIDLSRVVNWESSKSNVLLIERNDDAIFGTAKTAGESLVKVTLATKTRELAAIVTEPDIVSLAVQTDDVSLIVDDVTKQLLADVGVGMSLKFKLFITTKSGAVVQVEDGIRWESKNSEVAEIGERGVLKSLSVGQTEISGSFKGKKVSFQVRVQNAVLTNLIVFPRELAGPIGVDSYIRVFGNYSVKDSPVNSFYVDVSSNVTWTNKRTDAIRILRSREGETTITVVKSLEGENVSLEASIGKKMAQLKVRSIDDPLVNLRIDTVSPIVSIGELSNLRAVGTYQFGHTHDLTKFVSWTSSEPKTLLVDNTLSPGTVLGVAVGGAKLTSTQGAVSASIDFGVKDSNSVLTMSPASLEIAAAGTEQVLAYFKASEKISIPVIEGVWTSSNVGVAAVDTDGDVSAKSAGVATISAAALGMQGSIEVKVTSGTVSLEELTIASQLNLLTIAKSQTLQFSASGRMSDNSTQDFTSSVAWTVSNPSVARISSSGLLTALSAGSTDITATKDGISAHTTMTVSSATINSIALTPATLSLKTGSTQQLSATATFSDSSSGNISGADLTWTSSNSLGAAVSSGGLVTGVNIGQTSTITATISGKSAFAALSVSVPSSIDIAPSTVSVSAGNSQQLAVTGVYSDGLSTIPVAQISWSSGNAIAATVSNQGIVLGVTASQSATITGSVSGKSATVNVTVTGTSTNRTPTDITLSSTTIAENLSAGSSVGNLGSIDPDAIDTFTYSLVAVAANSDHLAFSINGNSLEVATVLDAETKNSYSIRIRTIDQGGLSFEKSFTISVTNTNEAPTDITLTSSSVSEGLPAATQVGVLGSDDPDPSNTHTYSLVIGAGSADNSSFTIAANALKTNAVFSFNTKNSYSIRLRTTDQNGLTFEEIVTITITNANDAPTGITLSANSVNENVAIGTQVGTLTTTDADIGDTHAYTLVTGTGSTDNASFSIAGNAFKTNAAIDFETKSIYSVRVRTTDVGGRFFEKTFTIAVTDVSEAPTEIAVLGISANDRMKVLDGNIFISSWGSGKMIRIDRVDQSILGYSMSSPGDFEIIGDNIFVVETFNNRVVVLDHQNLSFVRYINLDDAAYLGRDPSGSSLMVLTDTHLAAKVAVYSVSNFDSPTMTDISDSNRGFSGVFGIDTRTFIGIQRPTALVQSFDVGTKSFGETVWSTGDGLNIVRDVLRIGNWVVVGLFQNTVEVRILNAETMTSVGEINFARGSSPFEWTFVDIAEVDGSLAVLDTVNGILKVYEMANSPVELSSRNVAGQFMAAEGTNLFIGDGNADVIRIINTSELLP